MRCTRALGTSLAIFGLFAGAVPLKAEAWTVIHRIRLKGNLCTPVTPATVGYSIYGVDNPSTSAAVVVHCPIPLETASNVTATFYAFDIGGFDRHTSSDITCTLMGQLLFNGTFETFGSASTTGGGQGSGYQSRSGIVTEVGFGDDNLFLECTIPPVEYAGWKSHLSLYDLYYHS
jgi:hypothetical protein